MNSQEPPAWFQRALEHEPTSHRVPVLDCDIHYLRWGPTAAARPGILFLHAGGAHAQWWSFIAPFFAADRAVAAIDFEEAGRVTISVGVALGAESELEVLLDRADQALYTAKESGRDRVVVGGSDAPDGR